MENTSLTPSFDGKIDYELGLEIPQNLYRDEHEVELNARPFKIVHSDASSDAPSARKAVLCLQGYQGYPGEMTAFAKSLYMKGFDVWAPRNPGMGTCRDDFYRSNDRMWLEAAYFFTEKLISVYGKENLYLAGHSMGCSLCVHCAVKFGIKKMVLFAPAVGENILGKKQRRSLKFVRFFKKRMSIPWQHDGRYHFEYEAPVKCDYNLGKEYWSFLTPARMLDADTLFISSFRALDEVKTDTLVLCGGQDVLISRDTAEEVVKKIKENGSRAEMVFLEKCTHGIPYDIDRRSVEKAFSEAASFLCS